MKKIKKIIILIFILDIFGTLYLISELTNKVIQLEKETKSMKETLNIIFSDLEETVEYKNGIKDKIVIPEV